MRIALVHDFLTQYGGAEKVLEALHEIWPEAPVFVLFYDKKKMGHKFADWDIKVSPIQNLPFGAKKYRWYLPLMPAATERFNLNNFDLVISDTSAYVKGVLTSPKTLHISYIHTPTRYLWSDTYQYIEHLSGIERYFKKFLPPLLTSLRVWDYQASQRPDKILANSNFIAKRIKYYYHRDSTVIYPPIEVDKFYVSKNIENYYLLISRFRPYKKIDLAIQAFNKLKIPLKIIGSGDGKSLRKIAKSNIEFLGSVSDKEKAKYLSHAKALIHPQEEDFGITPLESMASGRPVIAYRAGGALETIVDGVTGKFFDKQTWEDLAEQVIKFDSKKFNPQEIRNYSLKFSKKRFKEEIKNLAEEYLKQYKAHF